MLFSLRLPFSGKAVHRIFASGGTEAFLEGHVHAFTTLGGVPTGKSRCDNLKAAARDASRPVVAGQRLVSGCTQVALRPPSTSRTAPWTKLA
jgi:hypothetical protein